MKKNYILLAILCYSVSLWGQYRWEAGAEVGLSNYQGDLVESTGPLFKEGSLGFGIGGRYLLNYKWAIRGNVLIGKLTGDDFNSSNDFRQRRGVNFETPFTEITFRLEWEPFGEQHYLSLNQSKSFFSPYAFLGPGLVVLNPMINYSRTEGQHFLDAIEKDLNENYFKTRFMAVGGLGVKYDVNDLWVIAFEFGMRYAFTDYLDGISHAGISKNRDWYSFGGISLFHRLPGTEKATE
ncbi:MAG: DUF6089 family protein [Saprospiraceae bacterium]